jgi:hypothetical protein
MDLIPKSIFKGKDSDGTTFKVNEWNPDSVGNLDMGPLLPMIFFWCCFMAIASPIMLLLSLIYYRGLPQASSIVGIVVGGIFLCACYYTWLPFLFLMIFVPNEYMDIMIIVTIATMFGNALLLIPSLFLGGRLKIFIVVLTIIGLILGTSIGVNIVKDHNFYEYKNNIN